MGARITRSRALPPGVNTLRTRRVQATAFVRRLQQYDDMLAQADNGLERRRNLFRHLLQQIMIARGVLEEVRDESGSEGDSMDIDPDDDDDDEDEDDGDEDDGDKDDEDEDDEDEDEAEDEAEDDDEDDGDDGEDDDDDGDEDDDYGDGVEYISAGSAPARLPTVVNHFPHTEGVPVIAAPAVNTVQQPALIHAPSIIARASNTNFNAQLPTPPPSPQLPVQQLPSPPPTPPAAPIQAQQQAVPRLRGGRAAPEHHKKDREYLEKLYTKFGQRRSRRNRINARREEYLRESNRIGERRRAMGGSYDLVDLEELAAAIERLLEAETGQGGNSVVAEIALRHLLDRVVRTIRVKKERLALEEARLAAGESGRSRVRQ
ncbi:MAG: hypothetical protein Q9178_004595 [Gyalolechia marmorata]